MSVLESAIGWLAPPQCAGCGNEGAVLCGSCSASGITAFGERCWRCDALSAGARTCSRCRHTGSPGFVWITCSYDSLARELINQYKFKHLRVAAKPMAKLMADTLLLANGGERMRRYNYLVIPVPTATSRRRERGFGHAELLAKNIARILKLDYASPLLRLDQARQVGSGRDKRLVQLGSSFAVPNKKLVTGRNILLVDDVVTTGGTIISVAKNLRAAGVRRVDALLFAKKL